MIAQGDSLDILKMKTVEARDLKVVMVTQITQLKELNLSNVSFLDHVTSYQDCKRLVCSNNDTMMIFEFKFGNWIIWKLIPLPKFF